MDRRYQGSILLFVILLSSVLFANATYDLRFVNQMAQEALDDGYVDVTVQIKSNGEPFRLGSSNLVFTYNPQKFRNPRLVSAHHFSGTMYNTITVTDPAVDRVSVNIELFAINYGDSVHMEFMDVVTIRFDQSDIDNLPGFSWRTISPNSTVVFADDERTIMNYGTLYQYHRPGPNAPGIGQPAGGSALTLHGNYPNPFNPETTVEFELSDDEVELQLAVYNMLGQLVRELRDGVVQPGRYRVTWDGRDAYGREQASGVYFLRLSSQQTVQMRRMMLVR